MPPRQTPVVYQLKVTLKYSKPPIWRRVLVRSDTRFDELHRILQNLMGWDNSHLHEFVVRDTSYGDTSMTDDMNEESRLQLDKAVRKVKDKFLYVYDFGDNWQHDIVLEKILPLEEGIYYPVCIAGKRASPLEDCGGVMGYDGLLAYLADPDSPEYEEAKEYFEEWIDESFDPEAFDMEAINAALRKRG